MFRSGGKQTNINGLSFEKYTCNYNNLRQDGFVEKSINSSCKNSFYLMKNIGSKTVYYTTKIGLKHLIKEKFNKDIFKQPDEAYLVHDSLSQKYKLYIIEKKFQNVSGSVDEKLLACDGIRQMYRLAFANIDTVVSVEYIFCLSDYFKNLFENDPSDKYKLIKYIIESYGVKILYGHDTDYFNKLSFLINGSKVKF